MRLILLIAFRNLFRQKSRSILLGIGIGLGVMVLVIGFSFSKGISRNVIDKVVQSNVFGHLGVYMTEKAGKTSRRIIRDKAEMIALVKQRLENVKEVREALHVGAYVAGNGNQSPMTLTGVDVSSPDILKTCKLISGSFNDFTSGRIEKPLFLEYQRAKQLNVNVGDRVRIRTRTIYGQIQTAELTLVAIIEFEAPIINTFIQGGLPLEDLKTIMGYQPHETSYLNIVMNDMGDTSKILAYADNLHRVLAPEPIGIMGTFRQQGHALNGILTGFQSNKDTFEVLKPHATVLKGDIEAFSGNTGIILMGKSLAEGLHIEPGMDVFFSYEPRFEKEPINVGFKVACVIDDLGGKTSGVAFINDLDFYNIYLNHLPKKSGDFSVASILPENNPLFSILSFSWKQAERTYTDVALAKKRREMRRMTYYGPILDVVSMKEAVGNLYQLESAINMMTLFGMVVVFSIILVGVLNTVRMNIRERIREIGTVRAVGMQKKQVVRTIVAEVGLLSLCSALFGVVVGYITIDLLSLMTFTPVDLNFSAVLDNGHLKFMPEMKTIVINIFLITVVTMATAYFPARKAAKMSVAEALGHYE